MRCVPEGHFQPRPITQNNGVTKMNKLLATLLILGGTAMATPTINKYCLDFKANNLIEHFDEESVWDGLSVEHRGFIDCLSWHNKDRYLDLLDEIEIGMYSIVDKSTGYVSKNKIQCLYKMETPNVPTLEEFRTTCVYTHKVNF